MFEKLRPTDKGCCAAKSTNQLNRNVLINTNQIELLLLVKINDIVSNSQNIQTILVILLFIVLFRYGTQISNYLKYLRGCPHGVIVKAMDCGIIVSSYSSRAIMFTFGQIPLGKV